MKQGLSVDFFNHYYYDLNLSFHSISSATGFSVGSLHRAFSKLGLKPVKHTVWNKGISCFTDNRILSGVNHPRWKDRNKYYIEYKTKRKSIIDGSRKCSLCDRIANNLHHIDGDTTNNDYSNLTPLCSSCHTGLHNRLRYLKRTNTGTYSLKKPYYEHSSQSNLTSKVLR